MSTIHAGNIGPMATGGRRDTTGAVATGPFNITQLTDRIRWGPVIAGLFATLATLALLGVLGAAIGMTAADAGDNARGFGLGAGIWGIISTLVAFFIGGWIASRTTSCREGWGTLHGAMVWMVAIPLLLYLLTGGAVTIAGGAAGEATRAMTNDSTGSSILAQDSTADQGRITPRQEAAAETGARAAWGTLTAMLLGLGAACAGGFFASRSNDDREDNRMTTEGYGAAK